MCNRSHLSIAQETTEVLSKYLHAHPSFSSATGTYRNNHLHLIHTLPSTDVDLHNSILTGNGVTPPCAGTRQVRGFGVGNIAVLSSPMDGWMESIACRCVHLHGMAWHGLCDHRANVTAGSLIVSCQGLLLYSFFFIFIVFACFWVHSVGGWVGVVMWCEGRRGGVRGKQYSTCTRVVDLRWKGGSAIWERGVGWI